ncbi:MAG: peptide chain release factor N(5)-glutamine methyltransferase [Acidobacteriota bacterium]|nr:peptide chain release factor N(5)-glutamine methyltransferase [Acidobacteriota bacterium]
MADAKPALQRDLVTRGLAAREARWLVDEFYLGADPDAFVALEGAVARRLSGEPLQYVIGHWPFRGLDLDVDPRVLIPRPETEELVTHALGELAALDVTTPLVVDLGCGSGAIGLALLDELAARGVRATVVAVDESTDALAVAKRNALKHGLHQISFVHSSWFDDLDPSLRGRVDLVVANPPYVGAREFTGLDEVLRYEPYGALVAADADGVEGFADVARVIRDSVAWLAERAVVVVEHGEGHGDAARSVAHAAGFAHVRDEKDLAGKDRVLVARR